MPVISRLHTGRVVWRPFTDFARALMVVCDGRSSVGAWDRKCEDGVYELVEMTVSLDGDR